MKTFILFCLLFVSGISFGQDIYKTPSGAKYHLATCRMVKNVSEKITIEQARELGLQPCKICQPQNIYSEASAAPNKAKGQAPKTVQCKGITKAGTRCKHMTSIANGYCFQHNPDKE
jgi:hypothetical protein